MSKIPKFIFRGITGERFEITQKELLILKTYLGEKHLLKNKNFIFCNG